MDNVQENQLVFEVDQPGDKFYMILDGEVKVLVPPKDKESSTI